MIGTGALANENCLHPYEYNDVGLDAPHPQLRSRNLTTCEVTSTIEARKKGAMISN